MHVVITGANGFVGAALTRRLLSDGVSPRTPVSRLTLVDQQFNAAFDDPRVNAVAGDFGDSRSLDAIFAHPVNLVYHLASVPGSLAEREPALGLRVNLLATLALFDRIASQPGVSPPRVVFASSIAVYGSSLPPVVNRDTAARPAMSYGAHKLMAEIMLADLTRRGQLDGISLRLPGIVARPGVASGHGSAFMSAVMHAAAAGSSYTCPVSREATSWWMSWPCCIDNLLHAARIDGRLLPPERAAPLPVLHLSLGQVVDALGRLFGASHIAHITHAPDENIERLFGRQPPLRMPEVEALGFSHDGNADQLVCRALPACQ